MKNTVSEQLYELYVQCFQEQEPERLLLSGLSWQGDTVQGVRGRAVVYEPLRTLAGPYLSSGMDVHTALEKIKGPFDAAVLGLPKNVIEAKSLIANVLIRLKSGGVLICGAANDAGGGRIKKILSEFGLADIQMVSKHHAKFAICRRTSLHDSVVHKAIEEGDVQHIAAGRFISMPGIYGWDKIDKGSEMLAAHLPADLSGKGADFGCGYGYLSAEVLGRCRGVSEIICADYDARALAMCERNLSGFSIKRQFLWTDLMQPADFLPGLDFVIMNPPFHDGKEQSFNLGQGFIKAAAKALKHGGVLWVVANAHLPYEEVLQSSFQKTIKLSEAQGFKVYKAVV